MNKKLRTGEKLFFNYKEIEIKKNFTAILSPVIITSERDRDEEAVHQN